MATQIEQQLVKLLQPLLTVPLITKGDQPMPERPYAELSMASCTALDLGPEVAQGVDDDGNLQIWGHRRAEIAIHYRSTTGSDVVAQLTAIMDGLRSVTVSEQFQLAHIGVEGNAKLKTATKEDAEPSPNSATYLSLPIHYSITLNDPVGIIENVHAATDGGELKIKLTR